MSRPNLAKLRLKDPGGRILSSSGRGAPEHPYYDDISLVKPIKLNHIGVTEKGQNFELPTATYDRRGAHSLSQTMCTSVIRFEPLTGSLLSEWLDLMMRCAMLVSGIVENKGTEVVAIDHEASCSSLIALLESYNIGAAVVVSEGEHIVGIISERDIVRAIAKPKRSINCMVFAQSSARHNC